MKPLVHPADEPKIAAEFARLVNMSAREIEAWLETAESKSVGQVKRGETESVGRQSARKIVAILKRNRAGWQEADYAHMRKVAGFIKRHLAQRPGGDIAQTRWRYSLMNWGHDPLKA
jgi:hypothetical protein